MTRVFIPVCFRKVFLLLLITLGLFLAYRSVVIAAGNDELRFDSLPEWVALPIHPAGYDHCAPKVAGGWVLSDLRHTQWPDATIVRTLPKERLDSLALSELSRASYLETGGRIVSVNGETIEFLNWRGISLSRQLEVTTDETIFSDQFIEKVEGAGYYSFEKQSSNPRRSQYLPWKLWRHATGQFEPFTLGGRILAFEEQKYIRNDCYPIGTANHEGCYVVFTAYGLLSYSRDGKSVSVNTVTDCAVD